MSNSLMKRVKVCGITRHCDGLAAATSGADALGFVFYEPSPRNVSVDVAADIVDKLPAFVSSVALFVDPPESLVHDVINRVKIDLLQFHGDESPEFCAQFPRPYIKALRVNPERDSKNDIVQRALRYQSSRGILLDAYVKGVPGGTGQTFDWSLIPADDPAIADLPIILAGGLTPDNVHLAARKPGIWALDVSGGVERSKGIKDAALIEQFCKGANRG